MPSNKLERQLNEADLCTFIDHRVGFEGNMNGNASFASVILTWGDVTASYIRALNQMGLVMETHDVAPETNDE
jgi:hypothetical protein